MKQDKSRPKQAGSVRKQAEKALAAKSGKIRKKPAEDMEKVVHELQVHQIELEMQNDELRKAQREIEESRTKYFELYDLAPVGYFTLNQKGIIKEVNLSGAKLLNTPKSVLLLRPFFLFVPPESRDAFFAHLKKVFTAGAKQTCELELMRKEGPFPVLLESIAINGEDADFSQCLLMVRDITERKRSETALQESESKYHSLFANMISGFAYHQIVLDKNGKPVDYIFLEINDAFEKLTGLKSRDIIGKRATEIIPGIDDDPADWIGTYGKVALTGKEIRFENYSEALKKWYSVSAYSPQKGYFVAVFDDITERKQTEQALLASEQRYRELVQNANSAIIRWSRSGTITFFNEYVQEFFGWSADEVIGKHVGILVPQQESTGADLTGLAQDIVDHPERYVNNINENICRDGRRVWMAWTNRAIRDENGQVTEILAVGTDITERTQKEEELRRLNRTLKALGNSRNAMMRARNEPAYLNDVCRIIVEDCGHAMVWIGFAEDDAAKTVRPVAYAGFDEGYIQALNITWADTERGRGPTGTAIRTGRPSICRNMLTDPLFKPWREEAIKRGYASSVVVPLMDGGKAIGAINIYTREPDPFTEEEVTLLSELAADLSYGISSIRLKVAHDRTEEAIRQSEERYRSLVEVSPDAVFVNRGERIVFANPAALQLFGAAGVEQVLGRSPFDMFEPSYYPIMRKRIETLLGGKSVPLIESRIVRLDGTIRDVEVTATPVNDSAGRVIQVILRDITERKRTENALRESREDLNRAQTVAHTGSWRLDVRRNELLWSDENWRIFGVPKGIPLTYETFLSTIHPDDREYVDKQWKAALQGEPYDIEHRIVVDGQVKWVRERAELEIDKDGKLKGGFGTTQDITEKKQAERDLQTLMEELKRSNSDLEQFAYAASHDLQEPLRVIAGFVSLLEKKYKEKLDDKAHEFIEYTVDGVKRMQVLIKDLLAYSQVGTKTKTFKPTICSVALEQAIFNLHTVIEESGAEITYDFLPTVSADISQLSRLFQNLIGNAIKFRGKDRLKIHIAAEQKGNEWVFSIQDNGIGIDPKSFDRIFVVFQRLHTREKYEGTGIGLAVCKKIVERHGGHIRVESEPGKGTTFYFTMPVME